MNMNNKAKAALYDLSQLKSLTLSEAIMYLHSIYNLDCIEEIIAQIRKKHIDNELTASQKAALKILATYIDTIT